VPDVVVVGGGIIGCATAYYLAREGASVTVLERGAIGDEASGAAAGMLAALSSEGGERAPAFDRLLLDSTELYQTLVPELQTTGIDFHYRRTGVIHLATTEDQAAALRERYEARRRHTGDLPDGEAGLRWLNSASEVLREEPEANPRTVAAMVSSREEYVDPRRITEALAAAAQSLGAEVRPNAPVTRLRRSGDGRLRGVSTPAGALDADTVLLAGGPWTNALAKRLGATIPVRPVRGQMLSLGGPKTPLRHMVWGNHAYLVPREDGQTYVGATVEEAGYRKRTTRDGIGSLRRGAVELIPGLRDAHQRRAWAGLRPGSPDGMPIMGKLPGWQNVWVSTGHFRNGILLAPISGQLVARSIVAGQPDAQLVTFDPARFNA
jgi:glycine oxidase